jgi:hypothetical protein
MEITKKNMVGEGEDVKNGDFLCGIHLAADWKDKFTTMHPPSTQKAQVK